MGAHDGAATGAAPTIRQAENRREKQRARIASIARSMFLGTIDFLEEAKKSFYKPLFRSHYTRAQLAPD